MYWEVLVISYDDIHLQKQKIQLLFKNKAFFFL